MSKITQLNEKALAITVPEGSTGFSVWEATMSLRGYKKGDIFFGWVKDGESYNELIPKGEYSILGRPRELDIVQCAAIKGKEFNGSLNSFLESKDVDPKSIIILIKQ